MSKTKIENYLTIEKWYHGTTLKNCKSILDKGIIVDHNKGNELDFGHGFYLSPYLEQAQKFIVDMLQFSKVNISIPMLIDNETDIPVVMEYEFRPIDFYNKDEYKFKILNQYDDEFAEFVFHNRIYNVDGESHHNNDLIFGVMSDSRPTLLIQQYKRGVKSKHDVIEGLKKSTRVKQISIHNQHICDILVISKIYHAETGEELIINV